MQMGLSKIMLMKLITTIPSKSKGLFRRETGLTFGMIDVLK